jgi:hypothetical protein
VFAAHGLPSCLHTDRGSHYFYTPEAVGPIDKDRLTQVGRALEHLGVEHIPAYSPQARGRSKRMFATLQDRLIKELAKAGIGEIDAAPAFIRDVYLPAHNARFARPAALAEKTFVAADPALLADAPAAGLRHGGRAGAQSAPHALHHAGRVSLSRSLAVLAQARRGNARPWSGRRHCRRRAVEHSRVVTSDLAGDVACFRLWQALPPMDMRCNYLLSRLLVDPLAEPDVWPASILVGKLDACGLQSSPNRPA